MVFYDNKNGRFSINPNVNNKGKDTWEDFFIGIFMLFAIPSFIALVIAIIVSVLLGFNWLFEIDFLGLNAILENFK